MSKFKNGKVFIIIPDINITTEIINYSTSRTKNEMPNKEVNGIVFRIVETSEPVSPVFSQFTWYSIDDILSAWSAL